jgi:hypothetical protein
MSNMFSEGWQGKVGNHRQAGGIETSILDNGPGRGMRIAWFDTGSGLRFKVHTDRGMNIADTFYNRYGVSWISSTGDIDTDHPREGVDWLDTFNGGLMFTCGLSHVGPPQWNGHERKGLHGRIGSMKAEVVSIKQPDIRGGDLSMSMTGIVRETTVMGTNLELRRTIGSVLGEPVITVRDRVINLGNRPAPHMVLYHCNLGWPMVDKGSSIFWKGAWRPRDVIPSNRSYFNREGYRLDHDTLEEHSGNGETCVFIDAESDDDGLSRCGIRNPSIGHGLTIEYRPEQLPCFTHWQHWSTHEFVTGLEPGNCHPIGSEAAEREKSLVILEPGEHRDYEIRFSINDVV